nr:zinc metallopeptidase [uncultured Treponema sp.]
MYDVKIAHIRGSLTDNYNPSTKVLSLSDSTFSSSSIAEIGYNACRYCKILL